MLGYATANEQLALALTRAGARLYRADYAPPDARVAVHFQFPASYRPIPGVRNVLFTMFESTDVEGILDIFAPAFSRSDLVVTPSRWCADLFSHYTGKPIAVCPLGLDAENFPRLRRRWTAGRDTFVWLYVGAPNRRKWTILPDLWDGFLRGFPPGFTHLYLKTTGVDWEPALKRMRRSAGDGVAIERLDFAEGSVYLTDDVTVDNRKLPRERLATEVYHRAHGQLFLHCGEGWGLTGLEGMATGLPLVVSDSTGTREYATSDSAFLVRTDLRDVRSTGEDEEGKPYDVTMRLPWPNDLAAVDAMGAVMRNYHRASIVARRGAEVARSFTWERAAKELLAILRETV